MKITKKAYKIAATATKINHDSNGNPRYVVHYLDLMDWLNIPSASVYDDYAATVKAANRFGGRKFHNKQYGGGIVFQSYNLAMDLMSMRLSK